MSTLDSMENRFAQEENTGPNLEALIEQFESEKGEEKIIKKLY